MTDTIIGQTADVNVDATRAALRSIRDRMRGPRVARVTTLDPVLGDVVGAVARLAEIIEALIPQPAVRCPACRQPVIPNADGTLPGHEISPGPKRSPMCRFRGVVTGAAWAGEPR